MGDKLTRRRDQRRRPRFFDVSERGFRSRGARAAGSKLGMLWAYFPPASFRIVAGREASALYTRGDKLIAFRFCPHCACMVNWEALPDRDVFSDGSPPKVGVNARLIEGLDARKLPRMT